MVQQSRMYGISALAGTSSKMPFLYLIPLAQWQQDTPSNTALSISISYWIKKTKHC